MEVIKFYRNHEKPQFNGIITLGMHLYKRLKKGQTAVLVQELW